MPEGASTDAVPATSSGLRWVLAAFLLASSLDAQEPASAPTPWPTPPEALLRFAEAEDDAAREAILRAEGAALDDLHHHLGLLVTRARAGGAALPGLKAPRKLHARFAATARAAFPPSRTIDEERRWLAAVDAAAARSRRDHLAALYSALEALVTGADGARAQLLEAVAAAHRHAAATEDGELARRAHLIALETAGGDRALLASRVRDALESYAATDLPPAARVARLELLGARMALQDRDADRVDAHLRSLRRLGIEKNFGPLLHARYLALALEDAGRRGATFGTFAYLERFADLLPDLEAYAREEDRASRDAGLLAEVTQYRIHVASHLSRAGAHARAAELLEAVRSAPEVPAWQRGFCAVLLAQELEARGRYEDAAEHAREGGDRLRAAAAAAAPGRRAWFVANAALGDVHAATASLLSGALEEGRAALARARAGLESLPESAHDPRLEARLAIADTLEHHARHDLRGALASVRRVPEILPEAPGSLERIQALFCETQLLLEAGDLDAARDAARNAARAADHAPEGSAWLRLAAGLGLAEIEASAGRTEHALRTLDGALATTPEDVEAARPALVGEARRLHVELRLGLPSTAEPRLDRRQGRLEEAARACRDALLAALEDRPRDPALIAEWLRVEGTRLAILELGGADADALAELVAGARERLDTLLPDPITRRRGAEWGEVRALEQLLLGRAAEADGSTSAAIRHYERAAAEESWLRRDLRWRAADGLPGRRERIHDRIVHLALERAVGAADPTAAGRALQALEAARGREDAALAAAAREVVPTSRLSAVGRAGGARRVPTRFTLASFRRALPEGRVALVYVVSGRGVYGLAASRRGIVARDLPIERSALESAVRTWLAQMEGGPDAFKTRRLLEAGRRLHAALLAPFAEELEGVRELVIVPDGRLAALPFAGLPAVVPETGADLGEVRFLAEREGLVSIASIPSLGTLLALDAARGAGPSVATPRAVLVTPSVGAEEAALAERSGEEKVIARAFGEERTERLSGARLGREDLDAALSRGATLLHFAGHASGAEHGAASGALHLGGDGARLTPEDVVRLPLEGTRLVVLNACGTARGPVLANGVTLGLGRAFLLGGAEAVLATSTRVPDRAARRLADAFYARWNLETSAARALLAAQRNLISEKSTRWPGDWAAYSVVGLP